MNPLEMYNNSIKLLKKHGILLILLCILLSLSWLSTTVEFSLYRMLSFRMFNELSVENPHVSTKCYANLGAFENLGAEEKAMFNLLFNIPEVKKEQTCIEFMKSDYSLTSYLISNFYRYSASDFERTLNLLKFIISHNTLITENTYGFSYKCKDSDAREKVCEIFNNDDSIEELYFKRVRHHWLLMRIEQKAL